jgi:hypothetical protein
MKAHVARLIREGLLRPSVSISAHRLTWFGVMLGLGLAPALINGYPIYFHDSAGYDGSTYYDTRLSTLALLATPLYPVIGVWSLVVVNAVVFAYLMTRFADVLLEGVNPILAATVLTAALMPFYVAFIAADVWLVFLFLAIALLLVRFSWSAFAIAVIAGATHGSHVFILAGAAVVALVLRSGRMRTAAIFGLVIAGTVAVTTTLNRVFPVEKLGLATVASKILNDVPQAVQDLCAQQPAEKICGLKDLLAQHPSDGVEDDKFIWSAWLYTDDKLGMSGFNELGGKLLKVVLKSYPLEFLSAAAMDFARFFGPQHCMGVVGYVDSDEAVLVHLTHHDKTTLARRGLFENAQLCGSAFVLQTSVVVIGTLSALWLLVRAGRQEASLALLFVSVLLINDAFFAFASGPFGRYHLRGLGLLALSALLALSYRLRQGVSAASRQDADHRLSAPAGADSR